MAFLNPQPDIRPIKEYGDLYCLYEEFYIEHKGYKFLVPKSFKYDGASTPKILWWFFPRDGLHRAAVLIHDWLYIKKGFITNNQVLSRKKIDIIFYEMLKRYGMKTYKAKLAYWAVRIGGYFAWKN